MSPQERKKAAELAKRQAQQTRILFDHLHKADPETATDLANLALAEAERSDAAA